MPVQAEPSQGQIQGSPSKRLRFNLNVRFSDDSMGDLDVTTSSSNSNSPTSSSGSSPESHGGFNQKEVEASASGRLQNFKKLIVQASLRKQKMVFSPARGKNAVPSSDTKATVLARSRRYNQILRLEESKLSRPFTELCWDDSC